MQMMIYLSTFVHEDGWPLVATACFLWYGIYYIEPMADECSLSRMSLRLLETAHVFLIGNYLYHSLLINYCNPLLTTTKVDDVSQQILFLETKFTSFLLSWLDHNCCYSFNHLYCPLFLYSKSLDMYVRCTETDPRLLNVSYQ
jgi:hypothetical protein